MINKHDKKSTIEDLKKLSADELYELMTGKQKKFSDYYIETTNATQSAIRAGYSAKTSKNIGPENLTKPIIKLYVSQKLKEMAGTRIAAAEEVLAYFTSVMRGQSVADVVVIEGMGEGTSSARSFSKNPDERERLKAAELLGKRHGLFDANNKMQVTIDSSKIDAVVNNLADKKLFNPDELIEGEQLCIKA